MLRSPTFIFCDLLTKELCCQFGFMDFREFFGVRPKDVGFKQTVIKKKTLIKAGKGLGGSQRHSFRLWSPPGEAEYLPLSKFRRPQTEAFLNYV